MTHPARAETRRPRSLVAVLAAFAFASASAFAFSFSSTAMAHDGHDHHASAPPPAAPALASGTGVIKKITAATQRLVLAHDPIAQLGWPAMTMPFGVADPTLLNGLKEGDTVRFKLKDEQTIVSVEVVPQN
jgi:Cu/Ag efflux protein CusF